MTETSRGQARPATSLGTLRGRLLDIASHPRIPEGASLTGIAILVALGTGLSCVLFLGLLRWITWLSFEAGWPLLGTGMWASEAAWSASVAR